MHEQNRHRQARMTRTKNTPLRYETHSVFVERSDGTGGVETMEQPVYDMPDWLASLRATRTRYRITLRHAAKRLGIPPSELSGIERGEFQTTPDEVRIFMKILKQTAQYGLISVAQAANDVTPHHSTMS